MPARKHPRRRSLSPQRAAFFLTGPLLDGGKRYSGAQDGRVAPDLNQYMCATPSLSADHGTKKARSGPGAAPVPANVVADVAEQIVAPSVPSLWLEKPSNMAHVANNGLAAW